MVQPDDPNPDSKPTPKRRGVILPPRMSRDATAASLMMKSPLTLKTSSTAVQEMIKRFSEFQRGAAGSWKFNDEERRECLQEAIDLLVVARQGILETPNCMEIGWMSDALKMLGRADKFLPRIPLKNTRDAKLWIEHGHLSDAVRDLKPFWQSYKLEFEELSRLLHLHQQASNYSAKDTNKAASDNGKQEADALTVGGTRESKGESAVSMEQVKSQLWDDFDVDKKAAGMRIRRAKDKGTLIEIASGQFTAESVSAFMEKQVPLQERSANYEPDDFEIE